LSDEQPKDLEQYLPEIVPGRMLTREDFTPQRARLIADIMAKRGGVPFMSEEARKASLRAIRASVAEGQDVWVFGYGSLMWNPAIHVADSRKAHVRGYHRTFCLTLNAGRGSPDNPGLMLGIDRGGSCSGVAHKIDAGAVDSELSILWYREMLSGAYEPRWINADIEGSGRTRALTFAINRSHPRYEGVVDEAEAARRIARAQGPFGTNRDYLFRTVKHLAEIGVADAPMLRLEALVRATLGEQSLPTGDT
jgi:cation transport protein ChaC